MCNKIRSVFFFPREVNPALALINALDMGVLKEERARVYDKLGMYTSTVARISTALQAKNRYEIRELAILEWIWPEGKAVLTPKPFFHVDATCQRFVRSDAYQNWIGSKGPSVLICTGKRMLLHDYSDLLAGTGKSHLVYLHPVEGRR